MTRDFPLRQFLCVKRIKFSQSEHSFRVQSTLPTISWFVYWFSLQPTLARIDNCYDLPILNEPSPKSRLLVVSSHWLDYLIYRDVFVAKQVWKISVCTNQIFMVQDYNFSRFKSAISLTISNHHMQQISFSFFPQVDSHCQFPIQNSQECVCLVRHTA